MWFLCLPRKKGRIKISTSGSNNRNIESKMYLSRMCLRFESLCIEGNLCIFLGHGIKTKSCNSHSYLLCPKKGRAENLLLHEVCQLPGLSFITFVDADVVLWFCFCFVLVPSRTDFIGSKSIKI